MSDFFRVDRSELIRRKWFPGNGDLTVHVDRHASVTHDLATITNVRTDAVVVRTQRGAGELSMSVEEARWLWSALSAALKAVQP